MTYNAQTGCVDYEAERLTCSYVERLASQYSGSTNLRALLEIALKSLEESEAGIADICACMSLDAATGDCLTAIGNLVGWPRTHCAAQCKVQFGFSCPSNTCGDENLLGWCSGDWFCGTQSTGKADYTFVNDDLYRNFIRAKILANKSIGITSEVLEVAQALLGPDTCLGEVQNGVTEIIVPRQLLSEEKAIIELVRRILPVTVASTLIIMEAGGPPFGFACVGEPCQPAGWCAGGFARRVTEIC